MKQDKIRAIKLRKQGKSYNDINRLIGVPKSTLSYWLKDVKLSKKVENSIIKKARRKWAKNITEYNIKRAKIARKNRLKMQDSASKEISKLSKKDLKLIGTALYWAEGYKKTNWQVLFCNSDPEMVKIMIRFFREICKIDKNKFRPNVQIHLNISENTAKKYWSKIVNLPVNSFKTTLYQSKASKGRRPKNSLPYGTFRLGINDVKLVNKIKGWITGLYKNV